LFFQSTTVKRKKETYFALSTDYNLTKKTYFVESTAEEIKNKTFFFHFVLWKEQKRLIFPIRSRRKNKGDLHRPFRSLRNVGKNVKMAKKRLKWGEKYRFGVISLNFVTSAT
jgi:hypothetical protein